MPGGMEISKGQGHLSERERPGSRLLISLVNRITNRAYFPTVPYRHTSLFVCLALVCFYKQASPINRLFRFSACRKLTTLEYDYHKQTAVRQPRQNNSGEANDGCLHVQYWQRARTPSRHLFQFASPSRGPVSLLHTSNTNASILCTHITRKEQKYLGL